MLVGIIAPTLELEKKYRTVLWENLYLAVERRGVEITHKGIHQHLYNEEAIEDYAWDLIDTEQVHGLDYLLVHAWEADSVQFVLREFISTLTAAKKPLPYILPLTLFTHMSVEDYEQWRTAEGSSTMAVELLKDMNSTEDDEAHMLEDQDDEDDWSNMKDMEDDGE